MPPKPFKKTGIHGFGSLSKNKKAAPPKTTGIHTLADTPANKKRKRNQDDEDAASDMDTENDENWRPEARAVGVANQKPDDDAPEEGSWRGSNVYKDMLRGKRTRLDAGAPGKDGDSDVRNVSAVDQKETMREARMKFLERVEKQTAGKADQKAEDLRTNGVAEAMDVGVHSKGEHDNAA